MLDALQKLKREFMARDDPWDRQPIRNCMMYRSDCLVGNHHHFNHIIEADPAFLAYATHPRIVGMDQGRRRRAEYAPAITRSC